MSVTDDSEDLLDHLTERINPNGWRVICNNAGETHEIYGRG